MRRPVQRNRAMSEINITPLTDVMMVLLVIFMVTTPLIMKAGIDINLPKAHVKTTAPTPTLQITVTRAGTLLVNGREIPFTALSSAIQDYVRQGGESTAVVSADEQVPYGEAIKVLDVARQAGVQKLVLAAEPLPTGSLSEEILVK